MKASDLVTAALILAAIHPASDGSEEPYLTGETLIASFADATLIGSNWAEYYAPDGTITGKVRYLGLTHSFIGRWTVIGNQVASSTGASNTTPARDAAGPEIGCSTSAPMETLSAKASPRAWRGTGWTCFAELRFGRSAPPWVNIRGSAD